MSRFFILFFFLIQLLNIKSFAEDSSGFMTPRDLIQKDSVSRINVRNNRSVPTTVYGLYVRQFAYVGIGGSCNNASPIYSTTENTTAGAFVMPTAINANKSAPVGSNYLYNMIYEAIYFASIATTPPPCLLPGCTWGTDSTIFNWCIFLGALAPVATSPGYTANVPPSTDAASGGGFNYNLITNYITLGPISCNDQTLTCIVANQQTQSFS